MLLLSTTAPLLFLLPFVIIHLNLDVVAADCTVSCPSGWTASSTICGKCYAIATGFDFNSLYYDYITGCQQLQAGADILAILNAFENAELGSFLKSQGFQDAVIGYTIVNNTNSWLSLTGYSSYAAFDDNYDNDTYISSLESDTLNWRGYDHAPQALCQFYPQNQTAWRPAPIACPDGFFGSITQPQKCYYNYRQNDQPVSFADATQFCSSIGAEIITLNGGNVEMQEVYWILFTQGSVFFTHMNYIRSSPSSSDWHWAGSNPSTFKPPLGGLATGTCSYIGNGMVYKAGDCSSNTEQGFQLGVICQLVPTQSGQTTTTTAALSSVPPSNASCPNNWLSTSWSTGKKCYAIIQETVTFQKAQELCLILGDSRTSELAALAGTDEIQALGQSGGLSNGEAYWLGLQTIDGTNWEWTSQGGGSINNLWASGQPDTNQFANHTCGELRNGALYSDDCRGAYRKVLCQILL